MERMGPYGLYRIIMINFHRLDFYGMMYSRRVRGCPPSR